MKCRIKIHLDGRTETVYCESGAVLLEVLYQNGYNIYGPCGGRGSCGKCLVKIIGAQSDSKLRLACRTEVTGDLELELIPQQELKILAEDRGQDFRVDPYIKLETIYLAPPKIDDQRDYLSRINSMLGTRTAVPSALRSLSALEQQTDLSVVTAGDKIIDICSAKTPPPAYGIAVDIGTTTLVMYLIDLVSGEEVGVYACANPQSRFGGDVITRIDHAINQPHGTAKLADALVNALNTGISQLCDQHSLTREQIYHAVLVGNTVMLHTLLGVNPGSIAHAPYVPFFTDALELAAKDLNLAMNPDGIVELLPAVSSYVGADIIADLLVTDFNCDGWKLLVDIGTNGEIVLGNKDQIFACSAAAGPAFEGARIAFGMSGMPGAVASYRITNQNQIEYETIGGREPVGICGSGLVDIIAALYTNGWLTPTGAFENREELVEYREQPAYQIIPNYDIFLTQRDVREYQLAAGAVAAGIRILIQESGIELADVDRVYLAGGFGNYINPESAAALGLIPKELLARVEKIGNGAGAGAKRWLLDRSAKAEALELKRRIKYIELSARADFQEYFTDAMFFPEY